MKKVLHWTCLLVCFSAQKKLDIAPGLAKVFKTGERQQVRMSQGRSKCEVKKSRLSNFCARYPLWLSSLNLILPVGREIFEHVIYMLFPSAYWALGTELWKVELFTMCVLHCTAETTKKNFSLEVGKRFFFANGFVWKLSKWWDPIFNCLLVVQDLWKRKKARSSVKVS